MRSLKEIKKPVSSEFKAFEKLFNSDPWTYNRQKKTEQQAKKWIITASFLIVEALILSAI